MTKTCSMSVRRLMLAGAAGFLLAEPAMAFGAPAESLSTPVVTAREEAAPSDPSAVGEVVVTASRVLRTGFTAPTPTTVLSEEELQRKGPASVADVLNQLPAFRPSATTTTNVSSIANSGQNLADLRGLGGVRTLVLVDGRRYVPTTATGQVDLNLIPSSLIERAEVVTGGASAAWGSDAVAGVVNLILKKRFKGVNAEAQYGKSTYGDGQNYKLSLALGAPLGDRGHIVVGGEYARDQGIGDTYSRPWGREERNVLVNSAFAANGMPANIYARNVRLSTAYPGGLITAGPLKGTAFGANGVPFQFQYGQVFSSLMIGGDGYGYTIPQGLALRIPVTRAVALAHLEYDFTPRLNGFLEANYGKTISRTPGPAHRDQGTIAIQADNAFIPASIRAQMASLNLATITLGRNNLDLDITEYDSRNRTQQVVGGLKGELGGSWKWNAYAQYGENQYDAETRRNRIEANWNRAIDAVVNPANGQIVCRSTLTNPTNGCTPLNLFGTNVASPAAIAYVLGAQTYSQLTTQTAAAANLSGEPFSTWAGPVSLAVGAEYRRSTIKAVSDPIAQAGGFRFGNPKAIDASLDVKEAYAETVIPLLQDKPFFKSLDLNGAVRITDYSTSGSVTTWKAGLNWSLSDELRLRATRSRDIRAPNLSELFNTSTSAMMAISNPANGDNFQTSVITQGNSGLRPETAKTTTAGVVYQPQWAPRLRMAVDVYRIRIADQITTIGGQLIVNRCFAGAQEYCPLVIKNPAGRITSVINPSLNVARFNTSGIDFEAAYSLPAASLISTMPGNFNVRLLATHVRHLTRVDSQAAIDRVGEVGGIGVPKWLLDGALTYGWNTGSATFTGRWIASGVMEATTVAGTATSRNINRVPAVFYSALAAQQTVWRSDRRQIQIFGAIDNLFNVAPPFPIGSVLNLGGSYYDVVGRAYRVGLRLRY